MTKTLPISMPHLGAGLVIALAVGLSGCEPSKPADGSNKAVAAEAAPPSAPVPDVPEAAAATAPETVPVEAAPAPEAVAAPPAPAKAPSPVQAVAPPPPAPQPVKAAIQPGVLPQGAGRNVAQRLCGTCHSLILVTANGHTEAEWDSIVARMESNGMQASADDINTVIDYLSKALPPR